MKKSKDYYGINWYNSDKKTSKYGILFECLVENDMKADVADIISKTFCPLNTILLDGLPLKMKHIINLKRRFFSFQ